MTCSSVRQALLALPDPRLLPPSLREHVTSCSVCRHWAVMAARLEGLLERLPVPPPPADQKSALKVRLGLDRPAGRSSGWGVWLPRWSWRAAGWAAGLAAVVLLVLAGGRLAPRRASGPVVAEGTPEHPFLHAVARRGLALARSDSPRDKFRNLAGLTDDLSAEAVALARVAGPDDLKDLARWFERVVKEGLVRQAERLPAHALTPAERHAELTALAGHLAETAARAEAAAADVPPEAQLALGRIRDSARYGERKLRELARGN